MPDFDAKLEALSAVASGDLPAHFHAHRADDIATAVRLSREFGLSYVIVHGPRAIWWPICWPGKAFRSSPAPADRPQQAGAGGSDAGESRPPEPAGVKVAICTDHPETPIQHLPLCAAMAVRYGMDEEEALAAITRNAAEIAGVGRARGHPQPGQGRGYRRYQRPSL